MTDPRPEPRWGQYAEVPPTPPVAQYPPPTPPVARPRSAWDVPVTIALLVWGVLDVIGTLFFARLSDSAQRFFDLFGIGEFTAFAAADQWGSIAGAARAAILLATIATSVILISRRRLAFWVPIAGWALATVVTAVAVSIVLDADPAYVAWLSQQSL